jgi:hypothetical protein
MDYTSHEGNLGHVDTGWFGGRRGCIGWRVVMVLGRMSVRVTIKSPIDVVSFNIMKRIQPQFAPLDIKPSAVGVAVPIAETDLQFRGCDDVVIRRRFDQRLKYGQEVTNPLERREIDRPELAGTVVLAHTAS